MQRVSVETEPDYAVIARTVYAPVPVNRCGFTGAKRGCAFELQKIAEARKLAQTLIVLASRTDVAALRAALLEGSKVLPHYDELQVVQLHRSPGREMQQVLATL